MVVEEAVGNRGGHSEGPGLQRRCELRAHRQITTSRISTLNLNISKTFSPQNFHHLFFWRDRTRVCPPPYPPHFFSFVFGHWCIIHHPLALNIRVTAAGRP